MQLPNHRRAVCSDPRNSECGTSSLLKLGWANWYLGLDMDGNHYLHVHRPEDDTSHRVYCKKSAAPGLQMIDGRLYWIL